MKMLAELNRIIRICVEVNCLSSGRLHIIFNNSIENPDSRQVLPARFHR